MAIVEIKKEDKSMMKRIIYSLCFFIYSIVAYGSTVHADKLYIDASYEQAIEAYKNVLHTDSSDYRIYYNIGNAYYRLGQLPLAILYYERAYKYNPSDKDVKHNLAYVRSQVEGISKNEGSLVTRLFMPISEMFSILEWCIIGYLFFMLSILLFMLYRFNHSFKIVRYSFFGSVFSLFLFIFANGMLFLQQAQISKDNAIVLETSSVTVDPKAGSTEITTLVGGSRVGLIRTDVKVGEWQEISLPSGKTGWIKFNRIERI
jgi:tetratricopeptide (TPR) repeat protein